MKTRQTQIKCDFSDLYEIYMYFNLWLRIIRANYGIVAGAVDHGKAFGIRRGDQEQKRRCPSSGWKRWQIKTKKKRKEKSAE